MRSIPPDVAAGIAFGTSIAAIIMTTFGFVWFGWGLAYASAFVLWPWIGVYAGTIVLFVAAVRSLVRGRKLLMAHAPGARPFWPSVRGRFYLVLAGEFVGSWIVVWITDATHRPDLLAAGIGVVVGLHFLPLSRLFRFSAYLATGLLVVLGDIVIALSVKGDAITFGVGIFDGAILWLTALYALSIASKFTRLALSGRS